MLDTEFPRLIYWLESGNPPDSRVLFMGDSLDDVEETCLKGRDFRAITRDDALVELDLQRRTGGDLAVDHELEDVVDSTPQGKWYWRAAVEHGGWNAAESRAQCVFDAVKRASAFAFHAHVSEVERCVRLELAFIYGPTLIYFLLFHTGSTPADFDAVLTSKGFSSIIPLVQEVRERYTRIAEDWVRGGRLKSTASHA
jgi:hypothetical protein